MHVILSMCTYLHVNKEAVENTYRYLHIQRGSASAKMFKPPEKVFHDCWSVICLILKIIAHKICTHNKAVFWYYLKRTNTL